ncbi:hypothetical protein BN2537_13137 [Streptomyces venezuelae]|nr:hypothetical protein BN2537_13137 [Streptomyces venezuelae]
MPPTVRPATDNPTGAGRPGHGAGIGALRRSRTGLAPVSRAEIPRSRGREAPGAP